MSGTSTPLRVAFLHPDLGIGGAERLVVDAALGLQRLGHTVDIYTSHFDSNHCFEETKDGSLNVRYIIPPFPRSIKGKFHILFAHLRQLHLTSKLLWSEKQDYDVFFVDQLSTCIPFLRLLGHTRVVFYCHFPDKLLASGAFIEGTVAHQERSLLKRLYRYPMDWLEEATTRQADVTLVNSRFTAGVFKSYFPSIIERPVVVYPGINISAYSTKVDNSDPDVIAVSSSRPTLLSLNRFEKKKNAALAITSFTTYGTKYSSFVDDQKLRLVIAGGYDPRLEDNIQTLNSLIQLVKQNSLTYNVIVPSSSTIQYFPPKDVTVINPDVLFLLNFTTPQRTKLLLDPCTKALLYTPANEHFGIGPVEAMGCGVPVLACDSGGPTESLVEQPSHERTGWLRKPDPSLWADALAEIISMDAGNRMALSKRAKERARNIFGMNAMARGLEGALLEAVEMGEVRGLVSPWLVMLFGFLVAYFLGPLIAPAK